MNLQNENVDDLKKSDEEPVIMDLDLFNVTGSGRQTLTLKRAHQIVDQLPSYFYPVGSIVRGKENPKDIDLISTKSLNEAYKYFENKFDIKEVKIHGIKRSDFVIDYKGEDITINLWHSEKANLGVKKLLLDYPKGIIIGIRLKLKKKGYHLSEDKLYKGNELVLIKDPKEIFTLAEVEYRTPEEEEAKRRKK